MPDYGSKGATCGLELELDSALLADVDSLRRQIRGAYEVTALAVEEQLRQELPQAQAKPPVTPKDVTNGQPHSYGSAGAYPGEPATAPAEPTQGPPSKPTDLGSRGGRNSAQVRKPYEPTPSLPPAPRTDGRDLRGREPRNGHELLGWISSQGNLYGKDHADALFADATETGQRLGYGSFFKAWTPEQAATVFALIRPATAAANDTH
jgi:hypothetical protein